MTRDLTKRQGVRWGRPTLGSLQLRARTEGFGRWNKMHWGDCLCFKGLFVCCTRGSRTQGRSALTASQRMQCM